MTPRKMVRELELLFFAGSSIETSSAPNPIVHIAAKIGVTRSFMGGHGCSSGREKREFKPVVAMPRRGTSFSGDLFSLEHRASGKHIARCAAFSASNFL
jgi:hypothetical protein